MPQALGLVETKGLVGAIVAADAMLKAANVSLIGKEKVTPALITIKIIGETAAVKSAIEAGAVAAQRVGQLISTHLIPNPDTQLEIFFPEITTDVDTDKSVQIYSDPNPVIEDELPPKPKKPKKESSQKQTTAEPELSEPEIIPKEEPVKAKRRHASLFDDVVETDTTHSVSTLERLKAEALRDLQSDKPAVEEIMRDEIEQEEIKQEGISDASGESYYDENSSVSIEELEGYNVHQLRKLARGVEIFPIHGREISRANRDTLLAYFKSLKK